MAIRYPPSFLITAVPVTIDNATETDPTRATPDLLGLFGISIIDEGQICSTAGLRSTTLISQYLSKNEKEHPHAHHASTTSYYYWLLGFAVQQFHVEKQAEKTENKPLGGLLTIFSWHEM